MSGEQVRRHSGQTEIQTFQPGTLKIIALSNSPTIFFTGVDRKSRTMMSLGDSEQAGSGEILPSWPVSWPVVGRITDDRKKDVSFQSNELLDEPHNRSYFL